MFLYFPNDLSWADHVLVLVQDVSRFLFTHTAANSLTTRAPIHLTLVSPGRWVDYKSGESVRALSVNWPRCAWKGNEKRLAPRLITYMNHRRTTRSAYPLEVWRQMFMRAGLKENYSKEGAITVRRSSFTVRRGWTWWEHRNLFVSIIILYIL